MSSAPVALGTPIAKDATALTYRTLRKVVGGIALLLPFALAIPWRLLPPHVFQPSISDYYYTGMRNLFVGCLCAIAMFLLSCKGFDIKDELAGYFSGLCAIGVAFCPTTPDSATDFQKHVGWAHYTFAALLFLTLSYFCLFLFTKTDPSKDPTKQKLARNKVYIVCGGAIIASIAAIAVTTVFGLKYTILGFQPVIVFESTSLWAFGVAWLVKGETILKDVPVPVPAAGPAVASAAATTPGLTPAPAPLAPPTAAPSIPTAARSGEVSN